MLSHGFVEELVCVLLVLAAASFGVGMLIGSRRKERDLTRLGAGLPGESRDRLDSVLREVHELRAHVADLTLMVDDARPRRARAGSSV